METKEALIKIGEAIDKLETDGIKLENFVIKINDDQWLIITQKLGES